MHNINLNLVSCHDNCTAFFKAVTSRAKRLQLKTTVVSEWVFLAPYCGLKSHGHLQRCLYIIYKQDILGISWPIKAVLISTLCIRFAKGAYVSRQFPQLQKAVFVCVGQLMNVAEVIAVHLSCHPFNMSAPFLQIQFLIVIVWGMFAAVIYLHI